MTEIQNRAIKIVVERQGKSISRAMRDAGYSFATAKNPKNLTESKTWNKLMNKYLPDNLLIKKHNELLTTPIKTKVQRAGTTTIETETLDTFAVSKGLDMAYKLKGKFAPEKLEIEEINNQGLTDNSDLTAATKFYEIQIKNRIAGRNDKKKHAGLDKKSGN